MLLDNNWIRFNSVYPFSSLANPLLVEIFFPFRNIKSFLIQTDIITSFYLNKILLLPNSNIRIHIASKPSKLALHIDINSDKSFSFILDSNDIIFGNISYDSLFYNNLLAVIIKLEKNVLLNIASSVLPIDPCCVILYRLNNTQSIMLNDKLCVSDVKLYFVNNTQCLQTENSYTINIFGDCPAISNVTTNLACTSVTIRNNDNSLVNYKLSGDSQLILKHSALSDIRVITKTNGIEIIGVADV